MASNDRVKTAVLGATGYSGIEAVRLLAGHPDAQVQLQFLENEAYKAKLPTLLQSSDPPDIFYSWAGGVLHAQVDSGVLRDLSSEMSQG